MEKKSSINVAVIGSGSVFTPELVIKFAEIADKLEGITLRFMDIDLPRQKIVAGLCRRLLKGLPTGNIVEIIECSSLEECIQGADFVLLQLRHGGIDARIEDEKLGKKYKLPFTETISVCGFATFLRTYYEYEKLAAAILKHAPNAWVLNFTNPAGQLSETLNILGISKVIGVCNAFMGVKDAIEKTFQIEDGSYMMNWRGLNHLTVLDGIFHNGKNRIEEFLLSIPGGGESFSHDKDMLISLGVVLNGYFQYYFNREHVIEKLQKQPKVRSELVKEIDIELLEEYKTADTVPEALAKRGGYGYSTAVVNIIRAICLDENSVHYAVVKNGTCLVSLPKDAFVEVPVLMSKNGAFPIVTEELPDYANVLAVAIKTYERRLITAARERDKKGMLASMMIHPLLNCYTVAKPLLEDVLAVNGEYMPGIG